MISLINIVLILFLRVGTTTDPFAVQAENYFKQQLKDYDSFTFEVIRKPGNITGVKFLSDQFPKNNKIISIPAEVTLENGKVEKAIISFRLRLYKNCLFSTMPVERNKKLNAEYFDLRKAEVNNINGTPVLSIEEIRNAIAKKNIKAGELLCREFIEEAPLIKAGERVTASIISGSTVISFDVVTKQDGKQNEIIRVAGANRKFYRAKVLDQVNVRIIE